MEWEIPGRSSKQNWLRGGLDPRACVCLFRRGCKKTSEKRWEAVMKIKVFVLLGTLAVFVVLGTMGAPQASAQAVYGSIFGTVTDPSGAAVAGSRVDLQFQVGGSTETVEVTSEAPQLTTDRADVATTFNDKYVQDVPILNRNFTSLQLMAPGSQKMVGWSHAATENPQGSLQIFTQGQHFSGTAFELDGTDNQDPILGIIVVNPNLDAV